MKVATKKPTVTQVPVYVTDEKYEIWISEPASLGTVDKVKGYWYTIDGMRFVSSRDAMRYLVVQHMAGTKLIPAPRREPTPKVERSPLKSVASVERKGATTETPAPMPMGEGISINQNHPLFEAFLDFIEYRNTKNTVARVSGDRRSVTMTK